jgi:hypothetical protein
MAAARIFYVGRSFVSLSWCKNHRLWKTELVDTIVVTMAEQQEVTGDCFCKGQSINSIIFPVYSVT